VIITCAAVLFDLDGVLVDSTAAVERVWRKWAIQRGLDPVYVVKNAHGRRSIETIRMVAPELGDTQANEEVEQLEIGDSEGVIAIPGALELIQSLPPSRFLIVTSATRALAKARLNHVGLPIPSRFVTAEDVANGKPSPEPYLKGAELLGITPQDCVVFEDTPAGIESGIAAGMKVIALKSTYPAEMLSAATAIVDSLKNVRAQLSSENKNISLILLN
jgi:sugar-phosphatase